MGPVWPWPGGRVWAQRRMVRKTAVDANEALQREARFTRAVPKGSGKLGHDAGSGQ